MVIVEVLGFSRSVLFGCHECWEVHTHSQGTQLPLVFCTNVVQKVRPFCHKLSHETTPRTTIFKQTPWSNLWNGATHPRKKKVKSVSSARKLMATVSLGDSIDLWLAQWSTKKYECLSSFHWVCPLSKMPEVLLLHDNAGPSQNSEKHYCCTHLTVLTSCHQICTCLGFEIQPTSIVAVEEGENYLLDGNMCCCSKVEEECWQN